MKKIKITSVPPGFIVCYYDRKTVSGRDVANCISHEE